MRTFICKHCGEQFTPDAETQKNIDDGIYNNLPDTCDECWDMIDDCGADIMDDYSDADPGL